MLSERKVRLEKLAKEDSIAPDVTLKAVATALAQQHLGCRVADSSTVRASPEVFLWREHLGKPKVNKFDVSTFGYHHVFGLEIPIDDIKAPQSFQSTNNLTGVEKDPILLFS
jgi:hypothetical protein